MVTGRKTNAAISESWGNVVYANDGKFLDDKGAKWALNSKEGLATIQWIVDLQTRHGVHPEVRRREARGGEARRERHREARRVGGGEQLLGVRARHPVVGPEPLRPAHPLPGRLGRPG